MSQFVPEDHQGAIDLVSDGDITFEADRDQDGAGDLVFRTGGVERARITDDGQFTGVAAADQVATIEELLATVRQTGATSGAVTVPLFIAQFACKIVAFDVMQAGGSTVAQSDTDYWSFVLRKWTAGTQTGTIATKTTKTTGGETFAVRTDWNFDQVTFDADAQLLAKGDVVDIALQVTGAPTTLNNLLLQLRYVPV